MFYYILSSRKLSNGTSKFFLLLRRRCHHGQHQGSNGNPPGPEEAPDQLPQVVSSEALLGHEGSDQDAKSPILDNGDAPQALQDAHRQGMRQG